MSKNRCVQIRPAKERLEEMKGKVIDQLKWVIHLVESDVHPERIEMEYKTMRDLISHRNAIYFEKQKEDRRDALA